MLKEGILEQFQPILRGFFITKIRNYINFQWDLLRVTHNVSRLLLNGQLSQLSSTTRVIKQEQFSTGSIQLQLQLLILPFTSQCLKGLLILRLVLDQLISVMLASDSTLHSLLFRCLRNQGVSWCL